MVTCFVRCCCSCPYFFLAEPGLTNGTPVEISSPASASVLLNRLQLDEDPEADSQDPYGSTEPCDLFVTVDDPKKHVSTMETYITYRVSTKVCFQPFYQFSCFH
ncbi:Sorting nexin-30 [Goodea atripinnis]|uniref:Sorting nexin-30 n=1 Tax=Goodea atripinnis TaxID=208336 RepID=A0ABV0MXY8_9TELE